MCLFISTYLYFQLTNTPVHPFFLSATAWVSWGFLLWGAYTSGRIIVDCARLRSQGEMSVENAWNGVLLALLNFLPTLGMSVFMIKEGFVSR